MASESTKRYLQRKKELESKTPSLLDLAKQKTNEALSDTYTRLQQQRKSSGTTTQSTKPSSTPYTITSSGTSSSKKPSSTTSKSSSLTQKNQEYYQKLKEKNRQNALKSGAYTYVPELRSKFQQLAKESGVSEGTQLKYNNAELIGLLQNEKDKYNQKINSLRGGSPTARKDTSTIQKYQSKIKDLDQQIKEIEDQQEREAIESGEYREATIGDLLLGSVKRGYLNSVYGQELYKESLGQPNKAGEYEELLSSDEYNFLPQGLIQEAISGAAELLGQQARQWTDPRSLAMAAAGAGSAAVAGQAGPQVLVPEETITVPGAALFGLQAGSALSNLEIEAGHAYQEMVNNGISTDTARNISMVVGAGNAALELVQLDELVKAFRVLNGTGASDTLSSAVMNEIKRRAVDVGKETAQEVAQEGVTIAGSQAASKLETGDWQYSTEDVLSRLGETALQSALSFGVLNVPGGVANVAADRVRARQSSAAPSSESSEYTNPLEKIASERAEEEVRNIIPQEEPAPVVEPVSTIEPETPSREQPQPQQEFYSPFDNIAETMGESGGKALKRYYDGESDSSEYAYEFVQTYNAGLKGEEKPAPKKITEVQSEAAYIAGQNDRNSESASKSSANKRQSVQIPIESRTWEDASNRKVNAFQYDHPELRPFYRQAAQELKNELSISTKGQRFVLKDPDGSIVGYTGVKRSVSGPVEQALDNAKLSYAQIEKAIDDLIQDNGQENYAAAKKIELVLDDMMTNGYTSVDGQEIDPNYDYISARDAINGALPQDSSEYRMTEEEWDSIFGQEPESVSNDSSVQPVQPIQTEQAEEAVMQQDDMYSAAKDGLQRTDQYRKNGFVLKVQLVPGDGYYGFISRDSDVLGGMLSDARSRIYTSDMFKSRAEAIDDILQVSMSNKLFSEPSKKEEKSGKSEKGSKKERKKAEKSSQKKKTESKSEGKPLSMTQPSPFEKSYKPEEEELAETPQQRVSDSVRLFIEKNTPLTSKKLFEIADKAYGGTMAEGAYTVKDAYDGMELAVNQYLIGSDLVKNANGDSATAKSTISKMQDILKLLPTQTKRTEEMESYQQFSTPPNIAYIAAWAANVKDSDVVLEPSAGIGGLALWPKAWGATVYGNELSERRLSFLNLLGLDGTFNFNAEQIDNLLPDDVKPSVVIMNPPFSSTAGRMTKKSTANAKRHIEQALERLEPGGRLVAILGNGMSNDAPAFKSWWDDLRKEYDVRANIRIDGSNYKKYGTTFDIQLAIIDKTGPGSSETLTGEYTDLSQIPDILEGIRNDRGTVEAAAVQRGERGAGVQPGRPEGRRDTGSSERAVRKPSGDTSEKTVSGDNVSGERPVQSEGAGSSVRKRAERKKRDAVGKRDDNVSPDVSGQPERSGEQPGRAESESKRSGTVKEKTAKLDKKAKKSSASSDAIEHPDSVYSAYSPKKARIVGSVPHPAKLVESAAMAAVDPPDVTYTPNIPQDIITSGKLSDAQLENIIYAGQSHEQILPNGTRRGYFIGDGTGVGKGRQISGIILDNFRQGRKKAVWISRSSNLLQDAIRDWTDLGGEKKDILSFNKVKLGQEIPADTNILFSSYDTLKQEKKDGSRLEMIQKWLGKDFDGVIVFDEAHTMNKAISQNGARGRTKPAGRALAGIKLQEMFPNARVVYASATGATSVDGYAYLERLGLWGKGTAFNDVNDFISKISDGGLAAMELVARDMKAMGVYMARSISYDDVRYDTVQHDLTPMQTQIYNTLSKAWQTVFQNIDKALVDTGASKNGMARSAAWSAFYGAQQRFYNQVITSMSMPTVIENIRKDLDDGKSVVIQLVNTNQASADRAISEAENTGVSLEELDLTPSDTLVQLLEKSFPVQAFEEYTDDKGNIQSRPVYDKDGNPVLDKKAIRQRDALIEQVKQMKVPDGPLEMLFDAFGVDQVAEVTGRTRRVVEKKDEKGHLRRVVESRSQNSGIADAQMFQDGKKRILVFSDAGGTGKSYHADLRAKNQQQRVHYLLQPGWNASNATQGFGRTHRSNEASAPIFRLVTTNIMGQKRFTSTIARRLDQLGALTKGQRQTGSGIFSAKDNLESPLAQDALEQYYKSMPVDIVKKLGLYQKLYDQFGVYKPDQSTARDIGKFLNRILSLEVDEQNKVFQGFYEVFDRMMDAAIANGTLDVGLENYVADKIDVIDENVIRTDKSGADTKYVQMKAYKKPELVTYSQLEEYRANFKKLVRMEDGSVRAVYEISSKTNAKGEIERRFRLQSPVMSKYSTFVENTLNSKTTDIPKKEWKKAWEEAIANAPEYEESTLHMLTGALLPIWNKLPTENTRVVRVIVQDGRQYLGRLIRADQIDGVLKNLGSTRKQETYTPDQISEKVLKQGMEVVLRDNRTRIIRSRVSNEWRMEITGQNVWYIPQQISGIISERINYQYRYFIPTGERGISVLNELMSINPVVDIREPASSEAVDFARDATGLAEHPERWRSRRVGDKDKTPMRLSDIIEKIRHDFGINITTGYIRGKGIRGQYNRESQGIRIKIANSLPDVAHELGHHLDNIHGLTDDLPSDLRAELIGNLDQSLRNQYPKKLWVSEGLAEFVRRFLQNRETAAIDYPQFTQQFLSALKNTDGPLIEQLADEVNAYYSLDTSTATSFIRFSEEGGRDFRTLTEKMKDAGDVFYQAWIDSNTGIRRFSEEAGILDPYRAATNAAYSDAMAGQILIGDLTDRNGQYVAPGLKTALQGINLKNKTEYRDFGEYLVVKHGPERLKEGLRSFPDDVRNSTNWMNARQLELENQYPQFKAASERLYQFESDFLKTWGVDTGLVSIASKKKWEQRWKFYVPFNRAMEKGRAGARRGFANQSSGIRKATGSGRDFIHPVDNIIFNVVRMVNAGVRNNVMQEIAITAERSGGMAGFIEKVPMPLQRKSYDATRLKKGLMQSIEESDISETDKDAAFDIIENIDDILYQYGRGRAKGDVITVMMDGKPEYWKINDKLLLESVTNLAPAKAPAWLEAYGAVSRFMTSNITGNNVLWSVFSNAPRDLMTFFTYSKSKNPLKLLGGIGEAYANHLKGQNADPLYKEYLAMGGGKASMYTADRNLAKKARKNFIGKKLDYLNPIEWLSFVSDTVEMGPRFSYYKLLRQKGYSTQDAFYEAMDITVNFRRGGSISRGLNKIIPFFNASVQGLDKFSRWIRATDTDPLNRKKVVAIRTTTYVAASLALAAMVYGLNSGDDEKEKEYQQLSSYTKNSYWCIPLGDGTFFTIPKPREIAVLSSFFETLMEYFHGGNDHAFDGFYDYAAENSLPSGLSDVAKGDIYGFLGSLGLFGVGFNMGANRDFMGKPIVSSGLESLEPKDQYTDRTSKIAKAIGGAFNQSPQMIDYFFQQTLGGWWKAQKALFPVGEAEIDPTLGIQGTYIRDSQYSTDLVNWMYDKSDASTRAKNSDPGDTEKAIEAKMDSNMTTFYSRYYAMAKNAPETTSSRATRQTVLDMIREYQKASDAGEKTGIQQRVESVCKAAGDTKYLPSVVQNTIKDEAGNIHSLSASQYVTYQTDYLRIYWETVEGSLSNSMSLSDKKEILSSAKDVAEDHAKARALKRIGASYDQNDYDLGGISPSDVAVFEAAYDMAQSEKDEDGNTIPGSKQEDVIAALEQMEGLTDEQRSWLFRTKYTSDKNNPWA